MDKEEIRMLLSKEAPPSLIDGKPNPDYAKWYEASKHGQETRKAYREREAERTKASNKKYRESEKGRLARERGRIKHVNSGEDANNILWGMKEEDIYGEGFGHYDRELL